jgi:signal transduction histidine kinase
VLRHLTALVGLRGRLIAALVLTAALTLGTAAVTLLGPLEHRLRTQEVKSLTDTVVAFRFSLESLDATDLRPRSRTLQHQVHLLGARIGGRVAILDAQRQVLADTDPDQNDFPGAGGSAADNLTPTGRNAASATQGGVALVASDVTIDRHPLTILVRKPLSDLPVAVNAVKRAFITAALAGLALAVLVGFGFGFTLLRRLRRLREATGLVTAHGPGVELVEDPSRDEVGDLSRAFVRMQGRLAEQENARRAFVATASHELRTPIASLQTVLELLGEELAADHPDLEDARYQAQRARSQSLRLAALASDLLDLSRLDAHVELRREAIPVHELSRAVIAEFDLRTSEQELPIHLQDEGKDCWAMGDPGAVARILRILLDNGLRFTPPGEALVVAITQTEGRVEIRVIDRGPGVPVHERDLIFERFKRGTSTGGEGGFGLGLAIGRELADRMGGELVIEDADVGARFCLRLQAARGELGLRPADVPATSDAGETAVPARTGA